MRATISSLILMCTAPDETAWPSEQRCSKTSPCRQAERRRAARLRRQLRPTPACLRSPLRGQVLFWLPRPPARSVRRDRDGCDRGAEVVEDYARGSVAVDAEIDRA